MPKAILVLLISFTTLISFGQTVLLSEDFSNGIPSTWQIIDADGHTPHASMSQFTAGWIAYNESIDTTAASTSYYVNETDQSEDYLILPKLSLATFTKLSWSAHSVDPSFPDGYHVLVSTTDSLITSFTDTLLTVLTENYIWNRKSIMLDTSGFANQDVYIAFRNFSTNGFILELDDIMVEVSDFAKIEDQETIDFQVYPNPASQQITINFDGDFAVQIISIDGQVVLTTTENTVNTSELTSGQYIVRLQSENLVSNQFLIIE